MRLITMKRSVYFRLATLVTLSFAGLSSPSGAQGLPTTADVAIPSGANFDKANFRLWIPPGLANVKAVLVLNPGSNGDGRGAVNDTVWQKFATEQSLALVASQLTDKPHD